MKTEREEKRKMNRADGEAKILATFDRLTQAMDLVPYMCASDDVVSDAGGWGLWRKGSIALGGYQCDFVFEKNGTPLRLVDQYPDRIRFIS